MTLPADRRPEPFPFPRELPYRRPDGASEALRARILHATSAAPHVRRQPRRAALRPAAALFAAAAAIAVVAGLLFAGRGTAPAADAPFADAIGSSSDEELARFAAAHVDDLIYDLQL